jgi:hypothetical protein
MATHHYPAASRAANEATPATAYTDRLLTYQEVNSAIGSKCRTSHTARNLVRRGLIRQVRINERVIRYSERSVRDLVEGRVSK